MSGLEANVLVVPLALSLQMGGRSGGRTRSSLAVVPSPDRSSDHLASCVLRGIGKSPASGKFSEPGRSAMATACAWLVAEGIQDLVIMNADWLNEEDVLPVSDLSEATRVWLLTDDCETDELVERFDIVGPKVASTESLDFWLQVGMDQPEDLWRAFPRVPLTDALTFRGTCARVFDPVEMERIDAMMRHGAADVMEILRSPGPETINRISDVVFSPVLPIWPAICNLRGAQLGALAATYRLDVSIDEWMAHRVALPTLGATARAALGENPEPKASVVLAIAALTGADSETLANLNVASISKRRDSVTLNGVAFRIPKALRSHVIAHLELYRAGADGNDPLFVMPDGDRETAAGLAGEFHAAAFASGCRGALGAEGTERNMRLQHLQSEPLSAPRERPAIELRKLAGVRG